MDTIHIYIPLVTSIKYTIVDDDTVSVKVHSDRKKAHSCPFLVIIMHYLIFIIFLTWLAMKIQLSCTLSTLKCTTLYLILCQCTLFWHWTWFCCDFWITKPKVWWSVDHDYIKTFVFQWRDKSFCSWDIFLLC